MGFDDKLVPVSGIASSNARIIPSRISGNMMFKFRVSWKLRIGTWYGSVAIPGLNVNGTWTSYEIRKYIVRNCELLLSVICNSPHWRPPWKTTDPGEPFEALRQVSVHWQSRAIGSGWVPWKWTFYAFRHVTSDSKMERNGEDLLVSFLEHMRSVEQKLDGTNIGTERSCGPNSRNWTKLK